MTAMQRYTDTCIAAAARRWPSTLADDMAQAWHAEVAAVQADKSLSTAARLWQRFSFATSLALSPSVEKENPVQGTWRDRLLVLGRAMKIIIGVAGIALLATMLPGVLDGFWSNVDQHVPHSVYLYTSVITVLTSVAVVWGLGTMIGLRATAPKKPASRCFSRSRPGPCPWDWRSRSSSSPNPAASRRRR